jgi:hypothetical protein
MQNNNGKYPNQKEQCRLAAKALNCEDARSALIECLQPLTDHIIESNIKRYVTDVRIDNEFRTMLLDVTSTALNDSLGVFINSDYKIGTIYSGYLKIYIARLFEGYTRGR